mgnify:CR=1 FL=1
MLSLTTTTQKLIELGLHGMASALVKQQNQPESIQIPFEQRLGAVVAPSQGELAAGRIEAYLAQMDGYAVTVQRDLPAAE